MTRPPPLDLLVPGARVRLAGQPDWGVGMVQSVVGSRVTISFEHAGKRLVNIAAAELEAAEDDEPPGRPGSGFR